MGGISKEIFVLARPKVGNEARRSPNRIVNLTPKHERYFLDHILFVALPQKFSVTVSKKTSMQISRRPWKMGP